MSIEHDQQASIASDLYRGFFGAELVYGAYCCGRLSLARSPQQRCSTCPAIPTPQELRSPEEAAAWARTLPTPKTA